MHNVGNEKMSGKYEEGRIEESFTAERFMKENKSWNKHGIVKQLRLLMCLLRRTVVTSLLLKTN
jgi:hypothetical protein